MVKKSLEELITMKKRLLKNILLATAILNGLSLAGYSALAQQRPLDRLGVATWGGTYTKSQILAYMRPYTQKTGIRFNVYDDYQGSLKQIREQVISYNIKWDVVDLELSDAVHGCEQGLLEKLDLSELPPAPDGTPAKEDFYPGTLQDCAVATVLWSTIVAYNGDRFQDNPPRTLQDFFDVDQFPGRRGLRQTPLVNLEWALMADGVPADKVYDVLSTSRGVDRAFRVLNKIRPYVVWWRDGARPPEMLATGEVVMTSTYNGRMYDPIVEENKNFALIWDGQVLNMDLWGITKHTPNFEEAFAFVKFSTGTRPLAEQARYIPYGPARRSSMALVPDKVKPYLPTAPENFNNALRSNYQWWTQNRAAMDSRFAAWLAQPVVMPEDLPR
jgi:putative spermidine/putrescine transport system substrate-binding protein